MLRIPPRLVFGGYRATNALVHAVPRSLALSGAEGVALAWWRASERRRAIVRANLRRATDGTRTAAELDALVRAAFVSYGRYWIESTRIDLTDTAWFERIFHLTGREYLDAAIDSGRGVILALPHLGSWEIGGMIGRSIGHPFTAVAEPLEPPELFRWFVAQRERVGLEVVAAGSGTTGVVLKTLESGGVLCLVADRDVTGDGIEVEFFGERARLPGGPALLALRSGAVLLPCAIYQRPQGHLEGVVRAPVPAVRVDRMRADTTRVTQLLAREFEVLIRAAPAQWHAFTPIWPDEGVS